VSLGEEGVLCVDISDVCLHMNQRVHLEIRKIGQEHMVLSPVPTATETSDSSMDSPSTIEDGGPTTETILPTPTVPTLTLEPASGS
jgi:peptidoglycan-associated lipoprotein